MSAIIRLPSQVRLSVPGIQSESPRPAGFRPRLCLLIRWSGGDKGAYGDAPASLTLSGNSTSKGLSGGLFTR